MPVRVTGIPLVDSLLDPVPPRGWIVEFYGGASRLLAHHAIAEAASRGRVAVVHVQDFGGLDPYLLGLLARARGASVDEVRVARAFRLQDVPGLVREAAATRAETIVVVDPYRFAPRSPTGYQKLTPITAALRAAAGRALVVVANRVSQYGWRSPEGGSFHHHSVHVALWARVRGRSLLLDLVKHPAKPTPRRRLVPLASVAWAPAWRGGGLLEYLEPSPS